MKISIRIPVADLSLDQACIYHLRAHHKIEYTAIAPDKAAYCVFTQFREPENAIKFISLRTKTQ